MDPNYKPRHRCPDADEVLRNERFPGPYKGRHAKPADLDQDE